MHFEEGGVEASAVEQVPFKDWRKVSQIRRREKYQLFKWSKNEEACGKTWNESYFEKIGKFTQQRKKINEKKLQQILKKISMEMKWKESLIGVKNIWNPLKAFSWYLKSSVILNS